MLGKLTALKPNRMEAELLSGVKIETAADAPHAAEKLLETGLQQVYISLGAEGLYAANRSGDSALIPCPHVHIANATAAVTPRRRRWPPASCAAARSRRRRGSPWGAARSPAHRRKPSTPA